MSARCRTALVICFTACLTGSLCAVATEGLVGIVARPATKEEARLAESLFGGSEGVRERVGAGGGAAAGVSVSDLQTAQVTFQEGAPGPNDDGNSVLVTWLETVTGSSQGVLIDVFINGQPACQVPARTSSGRNAAVCSKLAKSCLPGEDPDPGCVDNSFNCRDVTQDFGRQANVYIFKVSGTDGSELEVCQEVLSLRPFGNGPRYCCRLQQSDTSCDALREQVKVGGGFCDDQGGGGDCDIIVTGGTEGPPATYVEILLDGEPALKLENVAAFFCMERAVPVATSGPHTVAVRGFMNRETALTTSWFDASQGLSYNGIVGAFSGELQTLDCPDVPCGVKANRNYLPGDCNADSRVNISDAAFTLNHLFAGGQAPECRDACLSNADGALNITDVVGLLSFLFQGGTKPVQWADPDGDGVPACRASDSGECSGNAQACP